MPAGARAPVHPGPAAPRQAPARAPCTEGRGRPPPRRQRAGPRGRRGRAAGGVVRQAGSCVRRLTARRWPTSRRRRQARRPPGGRGGQGREIPGQEPAPDRMSSPVAGGRPAAGDRGPAAPGPHARGRSDARHAVRPRGSDACPPAPARPAVGTGWPGGRAPGGVGPTGAARGVPSATRRMPPTDVPDGPPSPEGRRHAAVTRPGGGPPAGRGPRWGGRSGRRWPHGHRRPSGEPGRPAGRRGYRPR